MSGDNKSKLLKEAEAELEHQRNLRRFADRKRAYREAREVLQSEAHAAARRLDERPPASAPAPLVPETARPAATRQWPYQVTGAALMLAVFGAALLLGRDGDSEAHVRALPTVARRFEDETPQQRAERKHVGEVAIAISNLHHCRAALRREICRQPDSDACKELAFYAEPETVLFERLGRLQSNRQDQLARVGAMLEACRAGSLSDTLGAAGGVK